MAPDQLASERARFEEVCRFGHERLEVLAHTVALAFAQDPVWKWMIDPGLGPAQGLSPEQALPLALALVANIGPADEAHSFRHHDTVALWHCPAATATKEADAWKTVRAEPYWQALESQLGDRMGVVGEMSAAMHEQRPDEPHWYLSILATAPLRQGQGLGARVMAPMIERCDRSGIATYLESSNPANHAFYARLGYQELGVVTGAGSPPMMRFMRPAAAPR